MYVLIRVIAIIFSALTWWAVWRIKYTSRKLLCCWLTSIWASQLWAFRSCAFTLIHISQNANQKHSLWPSDWDEQSADVVSFLFVHSFIRSLMLQKQWEDIINIGMLHVCLTNAISQNQFDWVIEIHYFDQNIPRTLFSVRIYFKYPLQQVIANWHNKWTQQENRLKRNHRCKGIRFIANFYFAYLFYWLLD